MTDETPIMPELNRRMLLRGGFVAGAWRDHSRPGTIGLTGVAGAATRPGKPTAVNPEVTFQTQFYWAYCNDCAILWYTHNNRPAFALPARHVKAPSFSYELRYNVSGTGGPPYQPGWNWCSACQSLFFAADGHAAESRCPAPALGGPHTTGGFHYSVLFNDAVTGSSQGNWWWCGLCQGLFNAAGGLAARVRGMSAEVLT